MSPVARCGCCKTRAAVALLGKKGTRSVRACTHCDQLRDWPVHKKRKGNK